MIAVFRGDRVKDSRTADLPNECPPLKCGHECVLDDIQAKVTVFDDGQTRAAIVECDLISLSNWIVVDARKQMEERTGILLLSVELPRDGVV